MTVPDSTTEPRQVSVIIAKIDYFAGTEKRRQMFLHTTGKGEHL
jgi:hypothetical protein